MEHFALPIEILAVATGFLCVWLYIRQAAWSWPVTIVSAALFFALFLEARLYANMGLQAVFIAVAFYGWHQWLRGGSGGKGVTVRHVTRTEAAVLGALTVAAGLILYFVLCTYTDAATPLWDSTATALSLTGQWMLARKMLENWLVWIAADIIFIAIYLGTGLYLTAALYAAYLGLAVAGYVTWRKP